MVAVSLYLFLRGVGPGWGGGGGYSVFAKLYFLISSFLMSRAAEIFLLLFHKPRHPAADKDEWTKNSSVLAPATRTAGQSSLGSRTEVYACRLQVLSQKCDPEGKKVTYPFPQLAAKHTFPNGGKS